MVLAVVAGLLGLLLLLTFCAVRYRQHKLRMRPYDFDELNRKLLENRSIMAGQLFKDRKPRELKRSNVTLLEQVGRGAFGAVWKAMLDERTSTGRPEYQVAAKTVLDEGASSAAAIEDLTTEATVMAQLEGHRNLVSIIGVVTSGTPLILVLAFCDHGSMLSYLKKRAAQGEAVSSVHKIDFGVQTARGLEHISGRKFIHRDLAARNVLLTSGKSISNLVCKVADFGLSRAGDHSGDEAVNGDDGNADELYYRSHAGRFPVRWTSPEAMEQLKFTLASDIWSFGILAIEIIQDGTKPFPNLKSNHDVVRFTLAGEIHPKPLECLSDALMSGLYSVACKCFTQPPVARPSFSDLAKILDGPNVEVGGRHDPGRQVLSDSMGLAALHGYGTNSNNLANETDRPMTAEPSLPSAASIYEYQYPCGMENNHSPVLSTSRTANVPLAVRGSLESGIGLKTSFRGNSRRSVSMIAAANPIPQVHNSNRSASSTFHIDGTHKTVPKSPTKLFVSYC
jgi:serine/threonine protein kinase